MATIPARPPVSRSPSGPQGPSLRAARAHRLTLLADMQGVERALAVPAGDPRWRQRVAARVGALGRAFGEHMVMTEGHDGLYAELLDHAPRLTRGVHVLIREHAVVLDSITALRARLDHPETTIDQIRCWGGDLLRELSRHRQRGADLVYQAYQIDIGGET
ncbi:hypothetical protein ACFFWC_30300 [Plantactinospora siamensis]|uniref:Hemerythrin-like domain-containing protein n=1 Tax=Plantactinospora siamensis TaxID=555372 RepID=A0ABV6NV07_9ACTN